MTLVTRSVKSVVLNVNLKRSLLFIIISFSFCFFIIMSNNKREHSGSDNEEDWVGPLPSEAVSRKKQKGIHV